MPKNESKPSVIEWLLERNDAGSNREMLDRASSALWPPVIRGFEEAIGQLALQLEQLRGVGQAQAEALSENTAAVVENTVAQVSGQKGSAVSSLGTAMGRVFASGLGLSPLWSGLVRLFTGGSKAEPKPSLPTYQRPPSVHVEGVVRRGGTGPGIEGTRVAEMWLLSSGSKIEYAASQSAYRTGPTVRLGEAAGGGATPARADRTWAVETLSVWRQLRRAPGVTSEPEPGWGREGEWEAATREGGRPVQVTVQVQAMDSRSFLDRSEDIARAVREAMLHSHALNDVINEL